VASVLALCCAADAWVLRTTWTGLQIAPGQFRRGYFESFGNEVGLAIDTAVSPVFPSFLLTAAGELQVPSGMTVVAPLVPGAELELASDSTLAPYVIVGTEAAVAPVPGDVLLPGEARIAEARMLVLREGRLSLVAWDAARPWRDDAALLSALRDGCSANGGTRVLRVRVAEDRYEFRLGHCSLSEPLPSSPAATPLLGAIAGPEWMTIKRRPGWVGERWVVWQILLAILIKQVAMWWGLGLPSAAASAGLLAGASLLVPSPAVLTWPVALIIGLAAAALRAVALVLRRLPRPLRVPAALVGLALAAAVVVTRPAQPRSFPPVVPAHDDDTVPATCAVIGYSMVGGSDLRHGRSGVRFFLHEKCARCRGKTATLSGGGENLAWARDAYCATDSSFGAGGQVVFLGGANDDFLWGVMSLAKMFIIGQQGSEQWRRSLGPAAAASLARIDAQGSALEGLMQCVRSRGAIFLFLHDFLAGDVIAGRSPDRAAMRARRQAVVEAGGGRFIDLLDAFGREAGVSWFNDYLHLSLIGHERVAALICRESP
jgi:hypothetical protein